MSLKRKIVVAGEEKEKPLIAKAIRELREHVGQSQSRFAGSLNVTKDAVAQWEAGRRKPNRWFEDKIYKFAQRCGRRDLALQISPPPPTKRQFLQAILASIDEDAPADVKTALDPTGPSPLTRQERKNMRSQAHTEIDMLFDRAPDEAVKKVMEHLDYYTGRFGRPK